MNLLTWFSDPIGAGLEVLHETDWFLKRLRTRTNALKVPDGTPIADRLFGAFVETYTDYYSAVTALWSPSPDLPTVLVSGTSGGADAEASISLDQDAPATATVYRQGGTETLTVAFTQSADDTKLWTAKAPMTGATPGLYAGLAMVADSIVVCQVFVSVAPSS